jgi:hypothetical protein
MTDDTRRRAAMTDDDTRPLSAEEEADRRSRPWDAPAFIEDVWATLDAERARHAVLVAAAEVTVGRFLDTPASLAGVHVAALADLRAALKWGGWAVRLVDGEPR